MDESLLQSKRNRTNNPWVTSGLIASIAKKYYLYDICRKSVKELKNKNGNPLLYSNYKDYRKSLKGAGGRGGGGGGGGLHQNSLEIDFIVVSDRGE